MQIGCCDSIGPVVETISPLAHFGLHSSVHVHSAEIMVVMPPDSRILLHLRTALLALYCTPKSAFGFTLP